MPETSSNRRLPATASGYELREQIGQGTCAAVYRAWCEHVSDEVAIKVVDLEWLQASLDDIGREIQVMSLSSHPHVVPFSTAFVQGADLWIVMPLLTGGSVLSLMNCAYREGLSEHYAVYVLYCVLKALEYFHGNMQIHRDVKAANLMLDSHGNVMLSDYGMMGWMVEGGWDRKQRQTFVGTPCWMAPEVMEQASGYDYKADVWSLGITAIELAEGRAPYTNYAPMKVLFLTLQNPPPTLTTEHSDQFSSKYRDFVAQCLQKDPKERPHVKQLLKHPLFASGVTMPSDLADTIARLPPIGSRGGSQKQLYRQLQKVAAPGNSGIWDLNAKGLGWDFGDAAAGQPNPGEVSTDSAETPANPSQLPSTYISPVGSRPDHSASNPASFMESQLGTGNMLLTSSASDPLHIPEASASTPTIPSVHSMPTLERSLSTISTVSTNSAPILGSLATGPLDTMEHLRATLQPSANVANPAPNVGNPPVVLPGASNVAPPASSTAGGAVPAKTVGLLKKGRFLVSDVVNPDKLGGKIDSFLDSDGNDGASSNMIGLDETSFLTPAMQSLGPLRGKNEGSALLAMGGQPPVTAPVTAVLPSRLTPGPSNTHQLLETPTGVGTTPLSSARLDKTPQRPSKPTIVTVGHVPSTLSLERSFGSGIAPIAIGVDIKPSRPNAPATSDVTRSSAPLTTAAPGSGLPTPGATPVQSPNVIPAVVSLGPAAPPRASQGLAMGVVNIQSTTGVNSQAASASSLPTVTGSIPNPPIVHVAATQPLPTGPSPVVVRANSPSPVSHPTVISPMGSAGSELPRPVQSIVPNNGLSSSQPMSHLSPNLASQLDATSLPIASSARPVHVTPTGLGIASAPGAAHSGQGVIAPSVPQGPAGNAVVKHGMPAPVATVVSAPQPQVTAHNMQHTGAGIGDGGNIGNVNPGNAWVNTSGNISVAPPPSSHPNVALVANRLMQNGMHPVGNNVTVPATTVPPSAIPVSSAPPTNIRPAVVNVSQPTPSVGMSAGAIHQTAAKPPVPSPPTSSGYSKSSSGSYRQKHAGGAGNLATSAKNASSAPVVISAPSLNGVGSNNASNGGHGSAQNNASATSIPMKRKSRFEVKDVPSSNLKGLTPGGSGSKSSSGDKGSGNSSSVPLPNTSGGAAAPPKPKSRFEVKDVDQPQRAQSAPNGAPSILNNPAANGGSNGGTVPKSRTVTPVISPAAEANVPASMSPKNLALALLNELQHAIQNLASENEVLKRDTESLRRENEVLKRENAALKAQGWNSGGVGDGSSGSGSGGAGSGSGGNGNAQVRSVSTSDLSVKAGNGGGAGNLTGGISHSQSVNSFIGQEPGAAVNATASASSANIAGQVGVTNVAGGMVSTAISTAAGATAPFNGTGVGRGIGSPGMISHVASAGGVGHTQSVPIAQVQAQAQRQAVSQGVQLNGSSGLKHVNFTTHHEAIDNGAGVEGSGGSLIGTTGGSGTGLQGHMHQLPTHVSSPSKVVSGGRGNLIGMDVGSGSSIGSGGLFGEIGTECLPNSPVMPSVIGSALGGGIGELRQGQGD